MLAAKSKKTGFPPNRFGLFRSRRMKILPGCLLLAAWFGLTANSNGSQSEQAFLQKFQERRQEVQTFAANFVQKKTLTLFDQEKISTGRVLFKTPHRMIWKYETPDKTEMLVTRDAVSFYFPSLEQIEVYEINEGKGAAPFFFAFEATADEIKENFAISGPFDVDKLDRVELTPKTEPLASEVKNVTLWLADADYLPRKILINENNGDTTEILLSDIQINQPISDEKLQLEAPEGTEIIREHSGL